jgi:Uma2 family endonuclease
MAVTGRVGLAEFLKLPEAEPALELRDGVVSQKMSPTVPHSALQFRLGVWLEGVGEPGRRLCVCTGARVNLGEDSFVPDLIAFHEDRLPVAEDDEFPEYFTEPPDLVIEIASPGQTHGFLIRRCRALVADGMPVVVLLDPRPRRNRTVREFRPDVELGTLTGSDIVDLGDVVPGLQFTADEIFAVLRARPA